MLSYRHSFHAGNHADILKHAVLCLLMRALNRKARPYSLIDTHAGAGLYSLTSETALKTREFNSGLAKVRDSRRLRELMPEYYRMLDDLGEDWCPGTAYLESALARPDDRLTFIELHPAEYLSLKERFKGDRRVNVQKRDSLESFEALLPPTPRRGLVFIDPPYEDRGEYPGLTRALRTGLRRYPAGVYALWYPVLPPGRDYSRRLVSEITRLGRPLLQAELRIRAGGGEYGLLGSGLLVLNYPYRLQEELEPVMDELYRKLCAGEGGALLKVLNPRP